MSLHLDINEIFLPQGALSQHIKNYIYREHQLELAKEILECFKNKSILLAEAGTGTGKTLAYLIPALLSDSTTVVSTGTKTLQNQLFFRDLPMISKAVQIPIKAVLLKGRNNYLCKYRVELALTDIVLATSEMAIELKSIINWSESTLDGDTSTLDDVPEDREIWRYVTSTTDNCLGQDCPFISSCFVYKARQAAMEAKVIVVNHHLLLSDWTLKSGNTDAKLLPNGVNLVLDEAHQIPDTATMYFGTIFSTKKVKDLLQDIILEQKNSAKDVKEFTNLNLGINRLLEQLQRYLQNKPERGTYNSLKSDDIFTNDIITCYDLLQELSEVLYANATRSKGLEACYERLGQVLIDFNIFAQRLTNSQTTFGQYEKYVDWYEIYKHNFLLKRSPLEIKGLFLEKLDLMATSCVMTSATLSGGKNFEFIKSDLGIDTAKTLVIPSPFEYKNKAVLYLPRGMPDPLANNYNDHYLEQVLPVLELSKGRAFLLFTSFASMHYVYNKLNIFPQCQNYNILMQGKASKTALIKQFTSTENSILLATASFWEGVDVKGPELQCVIIDKLPFTSPGDPLLQAKIKYMQSLGRNAFTDLQCQQAILHLTQGAGRLIRSESDYGVLMICDPRIVSRSYGALFLQALPPMKVTRSIESVRKLFGELV